MPTMIDDVFEQTVDGERKIDSKTFAKMRAYPLQGYTMGVSAIILPFPTKVRGRTLNMLAGFYEDGVWSGTDEDLAMDWPFNSVPGHWGDRKLGADPLHQWIANIGAGIAYRVFQEASRTFGHADRGSDLPYLVYTLSPLGTNYYNDLLIYQFGAFPLSRIDTFLKHVRNAENNLGLW